MKRILSFLIVGVLITVAYYILGIFLAEVQ